MQVSNICKLNDLDVMFVYANLSDGVKTRYSKNDLISSINFFMAKGLKFNVKRGVVSTHKINHLSSYSQLPHESNTLEDIVWNEFSPLITNRCSGLSRDNAFKCFA